MEVVEVVQVLIASAHLKGPEIALCNPEVGHLLQLILAHLLVCDILLQLGGCLLHQASQHLP